jgi:hypothetical protein
VGSVEPSNPGWRGFAIRAYNEFSYFRLVGMKKSRWRGFAIRNQVKHQRALQELNLLGCSSPISINSAEVERSEASFYRKEYRFAKEDDR